MLQLKPQIVRRFHCIQLVTAALLIGDHVLHSGPIFLFQTVKLVCPRLRCVQLRRRKVKFLPLIPNDLGKVKRFTAKGFHTLEQFFHITVQVPDAAQRILSLTNCRHCTIFRIIAVQAVIRSGQRGNILFTVAKQLSPGVQLLLLAGDQLRALQLIDLVAQGIHPPFLLRIVHFQCSKLLADITQDVIVFFVSGQRSCCLPETVQISEMPTLVQKQLSVMLAVDIQQLLADLAELCHRQRTSVYAANAFPLTADLALERKIAILIRGRTVFGKSRQIFRHI